MRNRKKRTDSRSKKNRLRKATGTKVKKPNGTIQLVMSMCGTTTQPSALLERDAMNISIEKNTVRKRKTVPMHTTVSGYENKRKPVFFSLKLITTSALLKKTMEARKEQ